MRRPTVGDKVKIISLTSPYYGKTGEIVKDECDGCLFKVKYEDDCFWWHHETDVQLIEESATPTRELKVGDKVRVKSREWYEKNKNKTDQVEIETTRGVIYFNKDMAKLCGKRVTISGIINSGLAQYRIEEDVWNWRDEMFDLDEPQHKPISEAISTIRKTADAISSILGKDSKPTFKENLPLIKTNKLLTQIKLD